MPISIFKLGLVSVFAAALFAAPVQLLAQSTNAPAAAKKASIVKKAVPATNKGAFNAKATAPTTKATTSTTNKEASLAKSDDAAKVAVASKPKSPHPFHGKLKAVDKEAKTIKLGNSTYYITAQTKITKGNKTATLDDGVVGEPVSGYVKPTEDGKMAASTVRFGPKP